MKHHDKKLRLVLMLIVVMCIIFSFVYEKEVEYHECSGQECPICLELHAARDLLNTIKASIICYIEIILIPVIVVHTLYRLVILRRQRTLITLKVKLRN